MLTWELIGTLIGAGFASGQEIASFFARFGAWGYAGAVLAVAMLVWLADAELPPQWAGKWPGRLWKMLLNALLMATGGAMLSGAGETMALILPWKSAYWIGSVAAFIIAWLLANQRTDGLAWIGRGMLVVFAVVLMAGMRFPKENAVVLQDAGMMRILAKGISYGGFNAAILLPVVKQANLPNRCKKHAIALAGLLALGFLWAGITVLHRQPAMMFEALPFIKLLNQYGKWGFYLSAVCLYMAILSTLTACIRGVESNKLAMCGIVLVSLLGFRKIVDQVYTVLGGTCMMMLMAAKFMNYARKAFISR